MNILMISESFVGGGLETQIQTFYDELRQEHKVVFAFARYNNRLSLDSAHIHLGFHFSRDSTIHELIEDVENLKKIIQSEAIDIIHVHPYFSIVPAMIASQLMEVPVVITYHGYASFTFSERITEAVLYYYGMYEVFGKIFTVSMSGFELLAKQFHRNEITYLPNPVNLDQFKRHQVKANRRWAAISRLDADSGKTEALKKLIDTLPQLNIEHIDVYGDGTCKEQLIRYVADKNLSEKVSFCGYRDDLYEYLDGKYNGIIGLGRVAIEGLTMGYPVLLLGYGNIFGVLDNQMVQSLKAYNFAPSRLQSLKDTAQLNTQLNDVYRNPSAYDMRLIMERDCNIKVLAATYIHELETTSFHPRINLVDFYSSLCQLPVLDESFYQCKSVSILTQKFVEYYAVYGDIKNLFLLQRTEDWLNSQLVNHINGLNWRIDQSQISQEKAFELRIAEENERKDSYLNEQLAQINAAQVNVFEAINHRITEEAEAKDSYLNEQLVEIRNTQETLNIQMNQYVEQQQILLNQLQVMQDQFSIKVDLLKAEIDENRCIFIYIKRFLRKIRNYLFPKNVRNN